jgi:hypothetical protein
MALQATEITRSVFIKTLIAKNRKLRDDQVAQLREFEARPGIGDGEIGATNRDTTQQYVQQLKVWIEIQNSLLADLNDLLAGKRDSI